MVDHADVDDRVLTDRLRQKRKGKRALLLFEVDAFDLAAVLRDQARLARQDVRDIIADARDLVREVVLHVVELAAKVIYLRAERVDAVVVMHADGDERGERHGRTADDLLVLYAEIAEAQLFRGSFFGVALNRRFGGILLGFGMLQTEQLIDGNGVELREFDELAKLRLRGAPFTYLKILASQSIFPTNL